MGEGGAEGQSRTGDTMIFSHVLYHLSYLGTPEGKTPGTTKITQGARGRQGADVPPFPEAVAAFEQALERRAPTDRGYAGRCRGCRSCCRLLHQPRSCT